MGWGCNGTETQLDGGAIGRGAVGQRYMEWGHTGTASPSRTTASLKFWEGGVKVGMHLSH